MAEPIFAPAMAKKASKSAATLPAVTIVIEWENAIDVEDKWTKAAMSALSARFRTCPQNAGETPGSCTSTTRARSIRKPSRIRSQARRRGSRISPTWRSSPTDGLTYYKLKNYGIGQSKTDLSIMLDSDAAPQPGWLENLVRPFADPKIMAVGGFTLLGMTIFLSRDVGA